MQYCRKTKHVWTAPKHFLCTVLQPVCDCGPVLLSNTLFFLDGTDLLFKTLWSLLDWSWTQLGSGGSCSPRPITITRSGGGCCSDWPSRWSGGWRSAGREQQLLSCIFCAPQPLKGSCCRLFLNWSIVSVWRVPSVTHFQRAFGIFRPVTMKTFSKTLPSPFFSLMSLCTEDSYFLVLFTFYKRCKFLSHSWTLV